MAEKRKNLPVQVPPKDTGKWNDTRNLSGANKRRGKNVPAAAAEPTEIYPLRFSWTAKQLDHEFSGDWDWDLSASELLSVLRHLEDMQLLTWREIETHQYNGKGGRRSQMHHSMPVEKICTDARERLRSHYADRITPEEIFRFRLGTSVRLWGARSGPLFEVLWFDRDHRVYPLDD